jgi:hypothetical protein
MCYNDDNMEDIYLDLSDKTEIVNFLSKWISFSAAKMKSHADSYITDYDDGKDLEETGLANFVSEFARSVYPVRYALDKFFNEAGAMEEWVRVEKAVRRSTAHLLNRFRKMSDAKSLDELLNHDDFDMSFGDEERMEIEQVRHHVREDYWAMNKNSLQSIVDEGEMVLKEFEEIISKLRDCASALPTLLQEELYSKITRFEDRVLYDGQVMSAKVLEEELAYYKDQQELPI